MEKSGVPCNIVSQFVHIMDQCKKFLFSYCIVYFYRSHVLADVVNGIRELSSCYPRTEPIAVSEASEEM